MTATMRFVKKHIFLYVILFVVTACFSCSYKQSQVLFQHNGTIDTTTARILKDYLIKSQDLLQIRNLQNRSYIVNEPVTSVTAGGGSDSNGQTYRVEDDGTVALPMLGHVKVAGLTRNEAAKQIEALYGKELKDPIIELKIVSLKVTVLGEITSQGVYNLVRDRTSLIDIIGEGGGLTKQANTKNVKIIRGGTDKPQEIEVDLSNINTLSDPRIILQNEDIIVIAQNKRAIRSEKLQNMSSVLQPMVILLNTALIIYTLVR